MYLKIEKTMCSYTENEFNKVQFPNDIELFSFSIGIRMLFKEIGSVEADYS